MQRKTLAADLVLNGDPETHLKNSHTSRWTAKHITARRGDPAGCFFNHKKLIQGLLKIGQRIYYIFDRIV